MLIIQKLRVQPAEHVDDQLLLPFELRQKSRLRTLTQSNEEVGLFLPQAHIMRDGELLEADDGRVVQVVAKPEQLLQVRCSSARELTRAAYYLGNRHVALHIAKDRLLLLDDYVLRQMLVQLGAEVSDVVAPFDPEPGAYTGSGGGSGYHHQGAERGHRGIIHQFGDNHVGKTHQS